MKSYSLEIERAALKDMKSFPRPLRELTLEHFDLLVENPFRGQPLVGVLSHLRSYHFRYKGTQYRIAYILYPEQELILVIMVGPRESFYKLLRRRLGM